MANAVFFSALLIIFLGYVLRKTGLVTAEQGGSLARLVLNVTLPALILQTVPQIEFSRELLFLPFLSLGHTAVAFIVTSIIFRRRSGLEKGVIMIASMGFNNGLFAFPIVLEIWGIEAIKLLAFFDVGNGIVVLGTNYVLAAYYSREGGMHIAETLRTVIRTLVTSVPLIAFAVGVVMNLSGLSFPPMVSRAVDIVASANGALALLVLGVFQSLRWRKGDAGLVLKVLGLRYLIGIASSIAAVMFLGGPLLQQQVLAIAFILPIGMTIIPYSVQFGLDTRLATTLVNVSIIVSFVMMWLTVVITG